MKLQNSVTCSALRLHPYLGHFHAVLSSAPVSLGRHRQHVLRLLRLHLQTPCRIRAANDRKAFYKWLYRSGCTYAADGRLIFTRVTASAFRNKKALEGKIYKQIPLYEADYTPETLQFFKKAPIPFIRELRVKLEFYFSISFLKSISYPYPTLLSSRLKSIPALDSESTPLMV